MKNSIDMTKGPIAGPLIRFILPLIGSSIFQQLYNTVDFLFVGNFMDKTAAAAVGASFGPGGEEGGEGEEGNVSEEEDIPDGLPAGKGPHPRGGIVKKSFKK